MFLEKHLPRIQKLIKEKLGELPSSTIHNEDLMRASFRRLYQTLPRMIRITVSEQGFEEFCMTNRERLLNFGNSLTKNSKNSSNLNSKNSDIKNKIQNELDQNKRKTNEMLASAKKVFLPTYSPNLILLKARESKIWDSDGSEYIDFGSGISVNNLGHKNPSLLLALEEQVKNIWHTTNLYLTEPAIKLAVTIVESTFADRVFFCNSGAEANEAAIKIARKFSSLNYKAEKNEIITFDGSFHGRTITTLTATAQTKYQKGFEPLTEGFKYCPFNDFETTTSMIGKHTCAVMVEPIQGEGGVIPFKKGFLNHLRKLCDKNDALLIFDEIQSGMGRTGKLFGYEWEDSENLENYLRPDILTMAKALGGGLPIGAMLCTEKVSKSFQPGDHGSTFGGNPIVTAVARAAFKIINSEEMFSDVLEKGEIIRQHLNSLNNELYFFEKIRGRGMMLGVVLSKAWQNKALEIVDACQKEGVLVLSAGTNVLRLLPPLNINKEQLKNGLERISEALKKFH